jgi:HSP20 family protein
MTGLLEPMLEFDRLFNRARTGSGFSAFVPPADVLATDSDVFVHMDVPGLGGDNLEIELEGDMLTVRGERTYPYPTNGDKPAWQRIERGFGKFERSVRVPRGLDPDSITADLEHGVLTIRIPKPEALKPHRVAINAGAETKQLAGATA